MTDNGGQRNSLGLETRHRRIILTLSDVVALVGYSYRLVK
jgi:hypothetical protein